MLGPSLGADDERVVPYERRDTRVHGSTLAVMHGQDAVGEI